MLNKRIYWKHTMTYEYTIKIERRQPPTLGVYHCINRDKYTTRMGGISLYNAPVSLCRIYCRTSTNWPFKFVRVIIPGHSSPFLSIRIGSVGKYESFEHVQNICVASTNKFHSAYAHWKRVFIMFVAQLTCCILVILTIFLLYSGCSNCILGDSYM